MNEHDSARIGDVLGAECGMSETDIPEEANLLLLNTCSVREKPQEKVFHQLGRWKQLKDRRPDTLIAVGGCVASQEGSRLGERAPFVDIIFGPQTLHRLPELVARAERQSSSVPIVDVSFPEIEKFDCLPKPRTKGAQAYVSVMEGCSRYCSFCVVPYTRGEEFSRPVEQVLDEIRGLGERGVREITLLGQNVNAYSGTTRSGSLYNFADLLYAVAEIATIERIRFTTSHPLMFGQDLVDAYDDIEKLAPQLHLPVQSGSDRILAAMKRGYTALEYRHKIRSLRAVRPDISISSDFIVGFPGEREKDFEATMELVHDIGFDRSFSFLFSPRPGTPAASLRDELDISEKKQRLYRLQALLNKQEAAVAASMVGTLQNVLVEGAASRDEHELQGRCGNNKMVVFPHAKPDEVVGTFLPVRIDRASVHSLRGSVPGQSCAMNDKQVVNS